MDYAKHAKTPALDIKLSLVAVLALVAGCTADATDTADDVSASSEAIVGGKATSEYPAVGALTQGGQPFCTGTLVGKRAVVTAAHCLVDFPAATIRFAFGPNAYAPQAQVAVSRTVVHPQYNPQASTNDIGMVILAQDAPVAPVGINDSMPASWVGHSLSFVGYGVTNGRTQSGAGTKRVVSMAIAQVGATQFAYADAKKNTCFGDSGGPALATDASGKLVVAGVTSYGDATCSRFGVDTRVDAFKSFVTAAQAAK